MRGRKPKPTALKVIEGNKGKRPLPKNEPKPKNTLPRCPIHLSKAARSEWRRLAKDLNKIGLLTQADRAIFALYCEAWARWLAAKKQFVEEGSQEVIETTRGNIIQNPLLGVINKLEDQIRKAIQELGLSPTSRARIQIPGQTIDDDLEDLLK